MVFFYDLFPEDTTLTPILTMFLLQYSNATTMTLLSCLGHLFISIINERLTAFIKSKQINSEAKPVLGKAILQPTKYIRLSVLLIYFMSRVKIVLHFC